MPVCATFPVRAKKSRYGPNPFPVRAKLAPAPPGGLGHFGAALRDSGWMPAQTLARGFFAVAGFRSLGRESLSAGRCPLSVPEALGPSVASEDQCFVSGAACRFPRKRSGYRQESRYSGSRQLRWRADRNLPFWTVCRPSQRLVAALSRLEASGAIQSGGRNGRSKYTRNIEAVWLRLLFANSRTPKLIPGLK